MTDTTVEEPDFDVIVVGAGIAGSVTAYQLATAGYSVCIVERGEQPGSKNLSGGVLYCQSIQDVFPDFIETAPIERRITKNYVAYLNADSSVALDYQDSRLAEPVNAVTVLRAKLDPWLAEKCEEAGVVILPATRVDEVLTESRGGVQQVVGVKAGDDELRSRVVVAADGVNSFVARGAGLRTKPPTHHLAVGVKAVVSLPSRVIEDRFGITEDQGAAMALVGDCTDGVAGGGFCYTNADTLSVGLVLRLDDLVAKKRETSELFARMMDHPFLAPYLRDGEVIEYGCHLIAEGGKEMVGEITTDGMVVVGDAAGLTLNTGFTVRGMDLAVGSAVAAATGIDAALKADDVSKAGLAGYPAALWASPVGKDMTTFAKAPHFMENDDLYNGRVGALVTDILKNVYDLDQRPRRKMKDEVRAALKGSDVKLSTLMRLGWEGMRSL